MTGKQMQRLQTLKDIHFYLDYLAENHVDQDLRACLQKLVSVVESLVNDAEDV